MLASSSNSARSRWLIVALLGGLGLVLANSGCTRTDNAGSKNSSSNNPSTPEIAEKAVKPLPRETPKETSAPKDPAQPSAPVTLPPRETPKEKTSEPANDPTSKALEPPAKDKPQLTMYPATFMGTQAMGQRFCIIADVSNSMEGAKLRDLKKELAKTLDGLDPNCQFYIILFNETDIPMPFPGWLDASKENVAKVKPWVEKASTKLHTWPQSSFERAFKLQPRPDVVFFMTDGMLQGKPDAVTLVDKLNADKPKVTIHTIKFSKGKNGGGKDTGGGQLRTLAEKNGGTYRHFSNGD